MPWPVRWAIRPPGPSHVISSPHGSSRTQARGRRAMPTLPQARGELCSGDHGVNESRTPSGTAPGARAEPVKPRPAFTLSGGPAPSRVGEVCKEVADAQSGFSGPAKAILSLRTGRLGGAGNPLTCRGPISISVSAAPTCNGSGIQVARSDDAPRINGSERTRPQGNDGRPILRRALGGPQELRRDLRRARRRGR